MAKNKRYVELVDDIFYEFEKCKTNWFGLFVTLCIDYTYGKYIETNGIRLTDDNHIIVECENGTEMELKDLPYYEVFTIANEICEYKK